MNFRKSAGEAAALVVAAGLCAAVSNSLAGPERKLRWVGVYQEVTRPAAQAPASAGRPAVLPSTSPPASAEASVANVPVTPAPASAKALAGLAADSVKLRKTFPPHPDKPWVEISGEDALLLFSRKNVAFLDARRTAVYREGHISGARPSAVWEADVDEKVKALYAEGLDQNAPVVVYCSGGECEDSHMLAQKLYMVGFNNVLVYKDGFPDWEKRGLPVAKGDTP